MSGSRGVHQALIGAHTSLAVENPAFAMHPKSHNQPHPEFVR